MNTINFARNIRNNTKNMYIFRRVIAAFHPYKAQICLILFAIFFITLLGLVNPLLVQHLFDDAIGRGNFILLTLYVVIMIVTPVVSGLVSVGLSYLNNIVGQQVMRDFRNQLYIHLQQMHMHFFTSTKTGEIQSRLTNDVNGVQWVITNTATTIVANVSGLVSTIVAMFILSPTLTFISLASLPFFLWITTRVGKARRLLSKETQKSAASLTAIMQEMLSVSGILLIKTFGRQEYAQQHFARENQKLTALNIHQLLVGRWLFMLISMFYAILPPIIYLVAGLQIIHHWSYMTFGTMIAFTTLQMRLYAPIGQLLTVQVEIQGALAIFERIFEYLDMQIEIYDKPDALDIPNEEVQGKICFDHVVFRYRSDESSGVHNGSESVKEERTSQEGVMAGAETSNRPALDDVSVVIQPGQTVALVGPSGAGKTTFTYLVSRLYDVEKGAVSIDKLDVRDIKLSSLSQLMGMVTQETYLFHSSIRENLLYARLDASEAEMVQAAKAAAIHERILELENGYDTIVGERGYKLSGGEKQRLSIARVLLKNPRILILDEATSSLDSHSECLIQGALKSLMCGRTTLVIAHRLSTVLHADQILVFNKGKIVEQGTHQVLLANDGLYAKLYYEQFL